MAYKFQLGAFVASGSIKAEEGVNANSAGLGAAGAIAGATTIAASGLASVGSVAVDDGSTIGTDSDTDMLTLTNGSNITVASDIALRVTAGKLELGGAAVTATAAEINYLDNDDLTAADITKLAALDATAAELNLLDGDTARGTTAVASGDGFIHNDAGTMRMTSVDKIADLFAGTGLAASSGVLSIDGNEVGTGHAVTVASDSFLFVDGGDNSTKRDTFVNLAAGLAGGAGLGASGGLISVNVDDSGIEIDSDTLRLKDNGVTLAKMAGLASGKFILGDGSGDPAAVSMSGDATLANNGAITLAAAQTNVTSLINSSLGKIGTAANQEYIDFGTADEIKFAINDSIVATVEAGKFVVAGDLQVNGTTTTVNSTTINISSSFTFEGPADDHETILSCGSPTADTTLQLFQGASGSYFMPAFSDANIKSTVIATTAGELNILDGDNARGTDALADGDGFIHNDNGAMKQTNVVKFFEYVVAKFSGDATVNDSGVVTIAAGAVHHSMLSDDIISGQDELLHADILDADELMISDGGVIKRVGVDSIQNHAFGKVSGDIAIADGGAATIQADAVESGMLNDNIISGQTELTSGNAVDADEMLISDGGVLKKIGLDSLKAYMSDAAADVALKDDGGTLAVGVNYFANHGGAESVTLPASNTLSVGQSIKIKAGSDCSSTNTLTINKAGSQTIDGAALIVLESPFAAVELVYVDTDTFRVF